MKSLLLSLLLVVSGVYVAQIKVEPTETQYLYLLTDKYEIRKPSYDGWPTYYSKTLRAGYDYPAIQEGFYSVNITGDINSLVRMYGELANLENLEDGTYKLSVGIGRDGTLHAVKMGNKIKLTDTNNIFKYAKYKMDDIKIDLELLKTIQNNQK